MAVPATRTWTISPNNTYSADLMDDQYQEGVFAWKSLLVAAGWTVVRSSNGAVVSDSDNWASSSDVAFGASGSGAWIVLRSPAGWLTNGGFMEVLMYVNDTAGTPQIFEIKCSTFGYKSGNLTTLPTARGEETTVNTGGRNIVPWGADAITGRYTTWRSSRGDVMMFVKEEGVSEINHCFALFSNEDNDGGGSGDQRWFFFSRSSTVNIFLNNGHLNFTDWRAVNAHGENATNVEASSILGGIASIADGQDFSGAEMSAPVKVWNDSAAEVRELGAMVDVFSNIGGSGPEPFNVTDPSEAAQDPQRVLVGSAWVYMPNGVTFS